MEQAQTDFFKDRTVAVTGGAGLIGSFLVEWVVAAGARVVVVDDFSKGQREYLAAVLDRIDIREGDLEDRMFARRALAGADVVFHLASRAYGVGYGQGHHLEILQHNERITDNVLDAVDRSRPAHLMVTSSSCVYDDDGPDTVPELPLFIGEPEKVNWGYGWAKRFLEQKATMYAREAGIPTTIVRPFNIYGERYSWVGQYSQAVPMLVKRVMDGEDPVVIWGSGQQRRSYIHASDCAAMMAALVARRHVDGPVNLGTKETIAIADLVGLICRAAGRSPKITCDREKPEGRFVKSADMSRLQAVVPDFAPTVDLPAGLGRMIEWYHRTFP
jgi:nucleoside-diphosphate-sugar epimerase